MTPSVSQGWQEFLILCHQSQSTQRLDELLDLLLTLEEKEQIALRVELLKELLLGEKTQREISSELMISIAKITRGSNALKTASDELKGFMKGHLSGRRVD